MPILVQALMRQPKRSQSALPPPSPQTNTYTNCANMALYFSTATTPVLNAFLPLFHQLHTK